MKCGHKRKKIIFIYLYIVIDGLTCQINSFKFI